MLASDGGSLVQPHFVSLDSSGKGPTLVFLEDTTLIVERVQQSKLAALGRLSASIAHEIRNPVGAMSHAAQLLAEAPDAVAAGAAPHGHHHQQRRAGQHHHQQRPAAVAARPDAAGAHRAQRVAGGIPGRIPPDLRGRRARDPHARYARRPRRARRSLAPVPAAVEPVRERAQVRPARRRRRSRSSCTPGASPLRSGRSSKSWIAARASQRRTPSASSSRSSPARRAAPASACSSPGSSRNAIAPH